MKKITLLFGILMLLTFNIGNAKLFNFFNKSGKTKEERVIEKSQKKSQSKFEKTMKKFELEAEIQTNKGNINVYLYPEAAPKNVANFVFLAKNNFYNGLTFHRVVSGAIVQGGDPNGDGTGTAGYLINDEIVNWLTFENAGVLAMANSGENTNGSQFFLTLAPISSLNKRHTIIGEVKSKEDLGVLRTIRKDDKITNIIIKGKKVDDFLTYFPVEVSEWESKLQR